MSKIVHPYSHRLGINKDWKSKWFASQADFPAFLRADVVIREFIEKDLRGFYVADVLIERGQKSLVVVIKTSRPGMLIGRSGEGITKFKAKLDKVLKRHKVDLGGKELKVDIQEVKNPESNAAIMGMMVAEGLEKRLPFRRVMKQAVERVIMTRGVEGVKIVLSGRLGGAEIARMEWSREVQSSNSI